MNDRIHFRLRLEGYKSVHESVTLPTGARIVHTVSINPRCVPAFDLVRLPDGSLDVQFRALRPTEPMHGLR